MFCPLETTYCVFAEVAMEQNAELGSVSVASQEQDEARVWKSGCTAAAFFSLKKQKKYVLFFFVKEKEKPSLILQQIFTSSKKNKV